MTELKYIDDLNNIVDLIPDNIKKNITELQKSIKPNIITITHENLKKINDKKEKTDKEKLNDQKLDETNKMKKQNIINNNIKLEKNIETYKKKIINDTNKDNLDKLKNTINTNKCILDLFKNELNLEENKCNEIYNILTEFKYNIDDNKDNSKIINYIQELIYIYKNYEKFNSVLTKNLNLTEKDLFNINLINDKLDNINDIIIKNELNTKDLYNIIDTCEKNSFISLKNTYDKNIKCIKNNINNIIVSHLDLKNDKEYTELINKKTKIDLSFKQLTLDVKNMHINIDENNKKIIVLNNDYESNKTDIKNKENILEQLKKKEETLQNEKNIKIENNLKKIKDKIKINIDEFKQTLENEITLLETNHKKQQFKLDKKIDELKFLEKNKNNEINNQILKYKEKYQNKCNKDIKQLEKEICEIENIKTKNYINDKNLYETELNNDISIITEKLNLEIKEKEKIDNVIKQNKTELINKLNIPLTKLEADLVDLKNNYEQFLEEEKNNFYEKNKNIIEEKKLNYTKEIEQLNKNLKNVNELSNKETLDFKNQLKIKIEEKLTKNNELLETGIKTIEEIEKIYNKKTEIEKEYEQTLLILDTENMNSANLKKEKIKIKITNIELLINSIDNELWKNYINNNNYIINKKTECEFKKNKINNLICNLKSINKLKISNYEKNNVNNNDKNIEDIKNKLSVLKNTKYTKNINMINSNLDLNKQLIEKKNEKSDLKLLLTNKNDIFDNKYIKLDIEYKNNINKLKNEISFLNTEMENEKKNININITKKYNIYKTKLENFSNKLYEKEYYNSLEYLHLFKNSDINEIINKKEVCLIELNSLLNKENKIKYNINEYINNNIINEFTLEKLNKFKYECIITKNELLQTLSKKELEQEKKKNIIIQKLTDKYLSYYIYKIHDMGTNYKKITLKLDENISLKNEYINFYDQLETIKKEQINKHNYNNNLSIYNKLENINEDISIKFKNTNTNKNNHIQYLLKTYSDIKNINDKINTLSDNIKQSLTNSESNKLYETNLKLYTDKITDEYNLFINLKNNIKFYKKESKLQKEKIETISGKLISLKQYLQSLNENNKIELDKFNKEYDKYDKLLEIYKSKIEEDCKLNKEKINKFEECMTKLTDKKNEINKLKKLNDNQQKKHDSIINKNKEVDIKIEELTNSISIIESDIVKTNKNVSKIGKKIEKINKSDLLLQEDIIEKENILDKVKIDHSNVIKIYEVKTKELLELKNKFDLKIEENKVNVEEKNKKLETLKESIKTISTNCFKIDTDVELFNKNIIEIDENNTKIIKEIKQIIEDEKTLKLNMIKNDNKLIDKNNEINKIKDINNKLRQDLYEKSAEYNSLNKCVNEKLSNIKHIDEKIFKNKKENIKLSELIKNMRIKINNFKREIDQNNINHDNNIQTKHQDIKYLEENIKSNEKIIINLKQEIDELASKQNKIENENSKKQISLNENLNKFKTKLDDLKKNIDNYNKNITDVKQNINFLYDKKLNIDDALIVDFNKNKKILDFIQFTENYISNTKINIIEKANTIRENQ
jgi:hypothetical protein